MERKFHGGCSGSLENYEGEFQWLSFGVHGDFGGQLLWPFGIFHFRDALFGFTNVFCDCGDFGLWGSVWGSLCVFSVCAGVRAYGVFLLFAFFVPCRARGSRRVYSLFLPRVALLCPRRPPLGPRRLWRSRRARALCHSFFIDFAFFVAIACVGHGGLIVGRAPVHLFGAWPVSSARTAS